MEIRCTCRARPLLGRALQVDGKWVVHIKVYKQRTLYSEVIVDSGEVRVRCRACLRWYCVRIKHQLSYRQEDLPLAIGQVAEKMHS